MGKFNIFEYIGSNMKKEIEFKRLYNVDLDVDENSEPFLDVSYNCGKDGKACFVGLRSASAKLQDSISVINSLELPVSIPEKPIVTVLYDTKSAKYELEYGKDKQRNLASEERFVVGYVIDPKSSLNFDEKIKLLYKVMENCIDARGFATVNGIKLKNPIFEKNKFNQIRYLDDNGRRLVRQENKELIHKTLKEKMGPQKTIK